MPEDSFSKPTRGKWHFWELERWDLSSLPVILAWVYAFNLIFFPTWLFGNAEAAGRLRALGLIIFWIIVSSLVLRQWLRRITGSKPVSLPAPQKQDPNGKILTGFTSSQWIILLAFIILLSALNIYAASYPLTSSGDEAYHASTFKGIGRNLSAVLGFWPGWLLPVAALAGWGGIRLWRRVPATRQQPLALGLLITSATVFTPAAWLAFDRLMSNSVVSSSELLTLVRFQPLSKFLWLPVSLCCWGSVFALRLPSILCWLLSGAVLYATARLRQKSSLALLPALFLLVMPGFFFYSHLIYITTPMILLWCIAFYFYERYWLVEDRRWLVLAAIFLNLSNLMRVESGYFAMALILHWAILRFVKDFKNIASLKGITAFIEHNGFDGFCLGWFGLSFIPLWTLITPLQRIFAQVKGNLLDPHQLLAVANEYPFHNGLLVTAFLVVSMLLVLLRLRANIFKQPYLLFSLIFIVTTYLLYSFDYLVVDYRNIGLFEFSREWQTAHRFLVSWSPFVALLLTEGITSLPWPRLRLPAGLALSGILLAQATFWAEPFTLPEFTSLTLRPGVEYPFLPTKEVLDYISNEVAGPDDKIFLTPHLGAEFYLDTQPHPQNWVVDHWEDYDLQTTQKFFTYLEEKDIDIVVLSLVWMNLPGTRLEIAEDVLRDSHFEVLKVFNYLDQPAIMVARFNKYPKIGVR